VCRELGSFVHLNYQSVLKLGLCVLELVNLDSFAGVYPKPNSPVCAMFNFMRTDSVVYPN
jgi:hypothetical protein